MANHIIMRQCSGASSLESSVAPEFSALDFTGWQGVSLEDSGVFMFVFIIEPEAVEFPIHSSEDAWLAYVISGTGWLYAGSVDQQATESIEYRSGDFITFQADTPHGWKNGGEKSKILFVKKS